jgi:heme o synthase
LKDKLKILLELTKIRITIFVTFTTAFGYIAASGKFDTEIISVLLGILFLACGSAAVNHYQERSTDALMERTKNRPIPSGKISPENALIVALLLN